MAKGLCEKCRREGDKFFLKGEKCLSSNCPFTRRTYTPGQRKGGVSRRRLSEYGEQLKEKQKAKKIYGVRETQFRNYFKKASRSGGATGETLLKLLEQRLDNVVSRLGFADSRDHARQLVSHGHIQVNGKKVNIPSFQVKIGNKISLSARYKKSEAFKKMSERIGVLKALDWLKVDKEKLEGEVTREPQRSDVDAIINESLIVEFYSR